MLSVVLSLLLVCLVSCKAFVPRVRAPIGVRSAAAKKTATPSEVVTIESDYKVAIGSWGITALLFPLGLPSIPFAALSALLTRQTGRVKFVFDKEAMEVFITQKDEKTGTETLGSRENFAVGGKNRWKYSTFLKWSFIPSKELPIFMYFTESQTDPKKPGGQFHLFPVIMNSAQLYEQLMTRVGAK